MIISVKQEFRKVSDKNRKSKEKQLSLQFQKSGLTTSKSEFVNAPIINEFPVTMECKFIEYQTNENGVGVIGEIVNVSADEKVLDENGKIIHDKIHALIYDPFTYGYYEVGQRVGQAFNDGKKLK